MLLAVVLLAACEVIPSGQREEVIFTPADPSAVKRTSLLIEYSGWQCVNCPTAAEEAHYLKEQYGENVFHRFIFRKKWQGVCLKSVIFAQMSRLRST